MAIPPTERPLLAIDGDSLAHRAYHALPKSIRSAQGRPANALVGFAGFLLTLWDAEQPASVLVGFDSLESPTYRQRGASGLPVRPGVRGRDPRAARDPCPSWSSRSASRSRRRQGYEADDFLAAAAAAWPGPVLVVTSDRDAFQLVS